MRLLSFTLLLLSLVLSSLAAPTAPTAEDPKTSIETLVVYVTRTILHHITEPSGSAPTVEEPKTIVEIIVHNVTRTVIHTVTEPTVLADAPATKESI